MPDPTRCCLLGICCPPGSKEQREALKTWLLEKLFQSDMPGKLYGTKEESDAVVDGWLDELFADNPALTQPVSEA